MQDATTTMRMPPQIHPPPPHQPAEPVPVQVVVPISGIVLLQQQMHEVEAKTRRLHSWVTFCVVFTFGMAALVILMLLQLGGWVQVLT